MIDGLKYCLRFILFTFKTVSEQPIYMNTGKGTNNYKNYKKYYIN
ncbi:hypothetical protein HMPREF1870_02119 [Bacteroidales bacterium KA00344]|nr:hypothetical protein HMPREF1870_02119 [Bacteroidales bacterium KA00344]